MALHGYLPLGRWQERRRRLRALVALVDPWERSWCWWRVGYPGPAGGGLGGELSAGDALVTFPYARRPNRELSPNRRNRLPTASAVSGDDDRHLSRSGAGSATDRSGRAPRLASAGSVLLPGLRASTQPGGAARRLSSSAKWMRFRPRTAPTNSDRCRRADRSCRRLLKLGAAIARDRAGGTDRPAGHADRGRALDVHGPVARREGVGRRSSARWRDFESRGPADVSTLVRIAPSVAVRDSGCGARSTTPIILSAWEPRTCRHDAPPSAVLVEGLLPRPRGRLVIVRGELDERVHRLSWWAPAAVPMLQWRWSWEQRSPRSPAGRLELVSVVPKGQPEEPAEEAIRSTLENAETDVEVAHRIVEAPDRRERPARSVTRSVGSDSGLVDRSIC